MIWRLTNTPYWQTTYPVGESLDSKPCLGVNRRIARHVGETTNAQNSSSGWCYYFLSLETFRHLQTFLAPLEFLDPSSFLTHTACLTHTHTRLEHAPTSLSCHSEPVTPSLHRQTDTHTKATFKLTVRVWNPWQQHFFTVVSIHYFSREGREESMRIKTLSLSL